MTKQDLQKELLEKVKEGIKPSDLKKKNTKIKQDDRRLSDLPKSDEGYESDSSDKSIPKAPPLPNQNLLNQITSLKNQLQTYKDFKEADLKIKEKYKEEIKEYKEKVKEQITKLENQAKNTVNNKQEPTKDKEPKHFLFTCDICDQNKKSRLHLARVNGLGIDPHKQNKICDYCINKVDVIKVKTEQEYI